MVEEPPRLLLEVVDADISALSVDVVVNAANDHLWMGSGVAGALKRRGGEQIERDAMEKGPIPVGTAVVTRGYDLPARWVVHAAVMGQDLATDDVLIRRCTYEALEVADRLLADTVALPAFGTGVGGVPLEECALCMAEVAVRFAPTHALRRVVFALHGEEARERFRAVLGGVEADPPARRESVGYFDLDD